MADLPQGILYGTVVGQFVQAVADTPDDVNRDPDSLPMKGRVTFTPEVPRVILDGQALPNPVTMFPKPIAASLDAQGYLVGLDGVRGIKLVASNSPGKPTSFTYTVRMEFEGIPLLTFSIFLNANTTVDLTTVIPVPSNPGEAITQWQALLAEVTAKANQAAASATSAQDAADDVAEVLATAASGFVKYPDPLANFRAALDKGVAQIAVVGDSRRDVAASGLNYHNALKLHIGPGALLEGMADSGLLNFGVNGGTIQAITSDARMATLTASTVHLIETDMGTNNMRVVDPDTGATMTTDKFESILVSGIEKIRKAKPGVTIIASIPSPFLTTADATPQVTPNADAALKSARMREAYLRLVGRWPDVIVRDTARIFGSVSLATSPYNGDQIHNNAAGSTASADDFAAMVGRLVPASAALRDAARAASPFAPWTSYGREVEDRTRYTLVAEGRYANSASGSYVDFRYPSGSRANFQFQDLIELPDGKTFLWTQGSAQAFGEITRILANNVPATTAVAGRGIVRVWRRSAPVATETRDAFLDTSWRFKRLGYVATASSTSATASQRVLDVVPLSATPNAAVVPSAEWEIAAGDRVYVDGMAALTNPAGSEYFTVGTDATLGVNGTRLRLSNISQLDRSALVNRLVVVVGTHAVATAGGTGAVREYDGTNWAARGTDPGMRQWMSTKYANAPFPPEAIAGDVWTALEDVV